MVSEIIIFSFVVLVKCAGFFTFSCWAMGTAGWDGVIPEINAISLKHTQTPVRIWWEGMGTIRTKMGHGLGSMHWIWSWYQSEGKGDTIRQINAAFLGDKHKIWPQFKLQVMLWLFNIPSLSTNCLISAHISDDHDGHVLKYVEGFVSWHHASKSISESCQVTSNGFRKAPWTVS